MIRHCEKKTNVSKCQGISLIAGADGKSNRCMIGWYNIGSKGLLCGLYSYLVRD